MGTRALRYLTEPKPIEVETDGAGTPITVTINGRRYLVDCIREEWLIQDQWWTEEPMARLYRSLTLENGSCLEVFREGNRYFALGTPDTPGPSKRSTSGTNLRNTVRPA
jgi:hypothetical protein